MPKIVIVVDGGVVQDVLSSEPVEVVLVDYDTDGADPADLTAVPQGDGKASEDSFVREWKFVGPEVCPTRVEELFGVARS